MVKMKVGKKVIVCILAAVMTAGSAVTVFAAETPQTPAENSQSFTQQKEILSDTSKSEKKTKIKSVSDGESTDENGMAVQKERHHRKKMTSDDSSKDGTEEVKKPKYHRKGKSAEDMQTSENGTETSKRRLHKKIKSSDDENTVQNENA